MTVDEAFASGLSCRVNKGNDLVEQTAEVFVLGIVQMQLKILKVFWMKVLHYGTSTVHDMGDAR